MSDPRYDVIVVGAGNAALCAAIAARETGARVLVLEKAAEAEKGGNSYFTAGGFRFVHSGLDDVRKDVLVDMADAEAGKIVFPGHDRQYFYETLMEVTHGQSDETLAGILIDNSRPTIAWLRKNGVRFIPMYGRQSFEVEGKHHFYGGVTIEAVGGGAGLVEFLLKRCGEVGVEIRYGTGAARLLQNRDGRVTGVTVRSQAGYEDIAAKAVVLACGGFESNPEMRVRYLGQGWDLARVRGTRHNTGDGIRMALDIGAVPFGNWSGCHSVAWDISRAALRRPLGARQLPEALLSARHHGQPRRQALRRRGRALPQPHLRQVRQGHHGPAAALGGADLRPADRAPPARRVPHQAGDQGRGRHHRGPGRRSSRSIPKALAATVAAYNAACKPGNYNPAILDGVAATGISPPKSNWALPIDKPPYVAFVVTTGVTFTFGGLKIDEQGGVQDLSDRSIPGLFAAGELVGGLFYENYPGGTGLMSGSVFGKRAGTYAAEYARGLNAPAQS